MITFPELTAEEIRLGKEWFIVQSDGPDDPRPIIMCLTPDKVDAVRKKFVKVGLEVDAEILAGKQPPNFIYLTGNPPPTPVDKIIARKQLKMDKHLASLAKKKK